MVSTAAFGHMTHHLMSLADGRVCVCLEVRHTKTIDMIYIL